MKTLDHINEHIANLNYINYQINELKNYKEEIEQLIVELAGRGQYAREEETGKIRLMDMTVEGQKTHSLGKHKVQITTEYIYKINKEAYKAIMNDFPLLIKEEVKVSLDKKKYKALLEFGDKESISLVNSVITLEPAKPRVKIVTEESENV